MFNSTKEKILKFKQKNGFLQPIEILDKKSNEIYIKCNCSCGFDNCEKQWIGRWKQVKQERVKGCKTYRGNLLSKN